MSGAQSSTRYEKQGKGGTAAVFAVIFLTLLLLTGAVLLVLNCKWIYYLDIVYLKLDEASGLKIREIKENYDALIRYNRIWYQGAFSLPTLAYSENGAIHFQEVKRIFDVIWAAFGISFLVYVPLAVGLHRKRAKSYLKTTGVLVLLIPVVIGVLAALNWERFFVVFHKIFFRNDYWLFDPEKDPVITILPDAYFLHCVIAIIVLLLLFSVLCFLSSRRKKLPERSKSRYEKEGHSSGYRTMGILAGIFLTSILAGTTANAMEPQQMVSILTREQKAAAMLMVSPGSLTQGSWYEQPEEAAKMLIRYGFGGIVFFREDLEHMDAVKQLCDCLEEAEQEEGVFRLPFLTAVSPLCGAQEALPVPETDAPGALMTGQTAGSAAQEIVWAWTLTEEVPEEYAGLGIELALIPGAGSSAAAVLAVKAANPLDDGREACLTRSMVNGQLRNEFDGLIFSDNLSADSFIRTYGSDRTVILAFTAGSDMLINPADPVSAYYGMLSSLDEQLIVEDQVNESVERILILNRKIGEMQ